MKKAISIIIIGSLAFVGCGGGDDGPGGPGGAVEIGGIGQELPTLVGAGSNTLEVEARIEATANVDERAATAEDLDTSFEIDVRDVNGVDVEGATVIVESALGAVTLTEGGCERRYCGSQRGYSRTYIVSVTSADDFVDGIRLSGPEFHTVDAPEPGAEVDSTQPLMVTWSPAGQADRVRFETRELDMMLEGDPGMFEVPADTLRARDDQPEDERIRIRRERETPIEGAINTSTLVVWIRNGLEFTTLPTN